jgi:hypothetical protein
VGSPFEREAGPAKAPPQRAAATAARRGSEAEARDGTRGSRRQLCAMPTPRGASRTHLRGSLALSNASLSRLGAAALPTPAPDWSAPRLHVSCAVRSLLAPFAWCSVPALAACDLTAGGVQVLDHQPRPRLPVLRAVAAAAGQALPRLWALCAAL